MTNPLPNISDSLQSIKRQIRLIVLLHCAETAGIAPIAVLRLHAFAYLSNVLAPVWDMPILDGKILRRRGGPFYPGLQGDLDRLVGIGVASISKLGYASDEQGQWQIEGSYLLNRSLADPIMDGITDFEDERHFLGFAQELAFALSALSDDEMDGAMQEDATYSSPLARPHNIIDFAEWQDQNYSALIAQRFNTIQPSHNPVSPGQRLHLYVRHLHSRINAKRTWS